jgi:hypothetical protein
MATSARPATSHSRSRMLRPSITVMPASGNFAWKRSTRSAVITCATRGGRPMVRRPRGLRWRSAMSARARSASSWMARACASSAVPASVGRRRGRALQQPLADFRFEQQHLPAQRGLRQVQGRRRTAEAAGLGHGGEVLQAGQVHRIIMCCAIAGMGRAGPGGRAPTQCRRADRSRPARPHLRPAAVGASPAAAGRACDTHVHVFGPAARFPYAAAATSRRSTRRRKLFALHRTLGVTRCVIVQSRCTAPTTAWSRTPSPRGQGRYLGVALVPPTSPMPSSPGWRGGVPRRALQLHAPPGRRRRRRGGRADAAAGGRRHAPAGALRAGAGARAGRRRWRAAPCRWSSTTWDASTPRWARTMPISRAGRPAAQPAVPREGERHRPHRFEARVGADYPPASRWRVAWCEASPTAALGHRLAAPNHTTCPTTPRWSTRWRASRPRPARASSCWSPIPPLLPLRTA